MPLWLLLFLLLLVFTFLVLGAGATTRRQVPRSTMREDVDEEALAAAEREVAELDADTSPEEADEHLPDWGPGAPRTPSG